MTSDKAAPDDTAGAPGPPFDTSVAHHARVYDYLLGGKDNYVADRAAAEATLKVWPGVRFRRAGEPRVPRARDPLPGRGGGDPPVP